MENNPCHKNWYSRGYLPHFDGSFIVQTITFRLADSLPRGVHNALQASVADPVDRHARLDAMIDEGRGACPLRDAANAGIVQDALLFFDGSRYRLIAWVVMPNHVHVMIEQLEGHRLCDVVRSWKAFTASRINARRKARGPLWARDYFDRFIRDDNHFANAVSYIENNPLKAGLVQDPADWPHSSARARKPAG